MVAGSQRLDGSRSEQSAKQLGPPAGPLTGKDIRIILLVSAAVITAVFGLIVALAN
jgi:hypothetical protein